LSFSAVLETALCKTNVPPETLQRKMRHERLAASGPRATTGRNRIVEADGGTTGLTLSNKINRLEQGAGNIVSLKAKGNFERRPHPVES